MFLQAVLSPGKTTAVTDIPVELIHSNPMQPRRIFEKDELLELAESIRSFGILQPISVRVQKDGYELIMGERRLRAAKLAGLSKVPCIIREMCGETAAVCAIIENIQRKDLNYFEEAEALQKLILAYGFTQNEVAKKLGRSQSAVANKLRLLRISSSVKQKLISAGLTERHARAVLLLQTDAEQEAVLNRVISQGLNVEETEKMISRGKEKQLRKKPIRKYAIKDMRLFWNTIDKAADTLRGAGIDVRVKKRKISGYQAYFIVARQ